VRNIWTIAKKEYDHYFVTPIAYIVAFVILLVLGFLFWIIIQNSIASLQFGSSFAPDTTLLSEWFVILMMFGCPALTMRLLADETRSGTIELLLTAPVRDYELVVGKWLGSFLFILTIIVITIVYPVILNRLVTPGIDWQLVISSYLGVLLAAAAFLAIGVGASALFSNQIAAYFIAFFLCILLLIFINIPARFVSAGAGFFEYVSMGTHFYNAFNIGKIQLSDIVYYLSLISLGLFTGVVAVESRRWN
jgi:ABC-2 type transport system permease protein